MTDIRYFSGPTNIEIHSFLGLKKFTVVNFCALAENQVNNAELENLKYNSRKLSAKPH